MLLVKQSPVIAVGTQELRVSPIRDGHYCMAACPKTQGRRSENQTAIAAAIEELALWVRDRGSVEVFQRVTDCLETLDINAQAVAAGIAQLSAEVAILPV